MGRHFLAFVTAATLLAGYLFAQATPDLEGRWEGTLVAGPSRLRLVVNVTKSSDGLLLGSLTSVDQGGIRMPMDKIELKGNSVLFEINAINGAFLGSFTDGNTKLTGTWNQGLPLPLELTRTASAADAPKPPDAAAASATVTGSPFGIPVEITVPVAPTPFSSGGKTHLVYELNVTNFAPVEGLISKLEVLNGTTTVAAFEGAELNTMLLRPGVPNAVDNRAVGPGQRAIAFLWITLDSAAPIPTTLRHRITSRNQTVEGGRVTVRTTKPIVLGPPLRGADWIAANGPDNKSAHRRALIPLNGSARIAQRFAIDWVQIGPNGRTFDSDQKDNKTYKAYGSEILAVADGVVASTKDGIPENVPGPTSRAVPITPDTIGGNNVILDLGDGQFAFYAHMQPGSLRVKVGDKVRRGQVLGLVGNSGNSTEPHLHFHLADRNSPLESEGLPYIFASFDIQTAPNTWEARQNQLPLQNARVRFPGL